MKILQWLADLMGQRLVVRGHSMEPTYVPGSRLLADRLSYLLASPARGDVVVIRSPLKPGRLEVKRIIGLPTEEIAWGQGPFQVNGTPLDEPYARIRPAPPGDDACTVCRLGPRDYFVAGDNRLYSDDSRRWGSVARSAIVGKICAADSSRKRHTP